jgi:hypothetical protein
MTSVSLADPVNLPTATLPELCRMMSGRRELDGGTADSRFVSLACGRGNLGNDRTRLSVCGEAAVRLESGELGADTVLGNLYAKSFDDVDGSLCGATSIGSSLRRVRSPLEEDLDRFTKRACESLLVGSPDSKLYASLCSK